jgi:hypothetical protein
MPTPRPPKPILARVRATVADKIISLGKEQNLRAGPMLARIAELYFAEKENAIAQPASDQS